MSTPILTKRQQKHSLSAKKTPIKGLRNVLAQPHDNYWPVVDTDKCPVLEDLMKKLTPAMKRPSLAIPWSQLRHMKKEERAQAKQEALAKEKMPDKNIVSSVVMGINATTRSLEKNDVCCVLLDANIEPALLVKHIILMAQNKKIPILLLPCLKSITLSTIGFACAAFALKNIVVESVDHYFNPLYTNICDIFKDIPPPKNSLQLFKDIETMEETTLCEDSDTSIQDDLKTTPSESVEFTISTTVYKYRSSHKERAFVPPSTTEKPTVEKLERDGFISLSHFDSDDENMTNIKKNTRYIDIHGKAGARRNVNRYSQSSDETKPMKKETDTLKLENNSQKDDNEAINVKYLPLKVKRLQGNSNRVKATKASKQKKK